MVTGGRNSSGGRTCDEKFWRAFFLAEKGEKLRETTCAAAAAESDAANAAAAPAGTVAAVCDCVCERERDRERKKISPCSPTLSRVTSVCVCVRACMAVRA